MDHGFTPYLSVAVDGSVRVPKQHVVDGEIVLNISTDATNALVIGNEYIDFQARFGGIPQNISIPMERVQAIYARENGQGMAFPVESFLPNTISGETEPDELTDRAPGLALVNNSSSSTEVPVDDTPEAPPPVGSAAKSKPTLKRIK